MRNSWIEYIVFTRSEELILPIYELSFLFFIKWKRRRKMKRVWTENSCWGIIGLNISYLQDLKNLEEVYDIVSKTGTMETPSNSSCEFLWRLGFEFEGVCLPLLSINLQPLFRSLPLRTFKDLVACPVSSIHSILEKRLYSNKTQANTEVIHEANNEKLHSLGKL